MPAQPGAGIRGDARVPAATAPSGDVALAGTDRRHRRRTGLAALLAHFGLPEGFGSVLLLALVAIGVVLVVRALLSRRTPRRQRQRAMRMPPPPPRVLPGVRRIEPASDACSRRAAPSTNFAKPLPPGFDAEGFLRQAKLQFTRLQAAWDKGDRQALADVMSPEMMDEIGADLAARGDHGATEIVALNAEMLEVTTEAGQHWASVRFTGLVREAGTPVPERLDEIWNLTKPVDGSSGWLLAGIRQTA